jgi:hypothetical protein
MFELVVHDREVLVVFDLLLLMSNHFRVHLVLMDEILYIIYLLLLSSFSLSLAYRP